MLGMSVSDTNFAAAAAIACNVAPCDLTAQLKALEK
jgi:hypothetical protein